MRKLLRLVTKTGVKLLSRRGLSKFRIVRATYKFLTRHSKSNTSEAEVLGHKMFLDSEDSLKLSVRGVYEEFETEIVKKEVKEGDTVLDIGANIGYYTLIFAKLVGTKGKVYAFEPDPSNFALLKKNVEANNYKNVELIQKAVTDRTGKVKLYLCEENKGDHRIYDSQDNRKAVEIGAIKLDDYFSNFKGRVNFIKIDIEGSEVGAFRGMDKLLNKNKDVKIFSEFCPFLIKKAGEDASELLSMLSRHGFEIYDINYGKKKVEKANASELLKRYSAEKDNFTNLLCVRKATLL